MHDSPDTLQYRKIHIVPSLMALDSAVRSVKIVSVARFESTDKNNAIANLGKSTLALA